MVVAIACVDDDKDFPHARLVRWAQWAHSPLPGTLTTAEGYMRERLDHAYEGQPTEEIAITDKAVAQVRVQRKDYWRVLSRFYLEHLAEFEIASDFGHNLEHVRALLRQAKILTAYHIRRLEGS